MLPGGLGGDGDAVGLARQERGGEGEGPVVGHVQVVAPVVLEDQRARQPRHGAADGVRRRWRGGRAVYVPARPVGGGGGAGGHDAGGPAGQAGVGGGDDGDAVFGEAERAGTGGEGELGAGSEGATGVGGAELGPGAVDPLEQHQIGAAAVPVVEADVEAAAGALDADHGPDPLGPAKRSGGDLDAGILVALVGLGSADVTGVPPAMVPVTIWEEMASGPSDNAVQFGPKGPLGRAKLSVIEVAP